MSNGINISRSYQKGTCSFMSAVSMGEDLCPIYDVVGELIIITVGGFFAPAC